MIKVEYIRDYNETYDSLYALVNDTRDAVGYDTDLNKGVTSFFNSKTGDFIGIDFVDNFTEYRKEIIRLKSDDEILKKFSIDVEYHQKDYPSFDEKLYKKQILAIVDFIKKTNPKKMSIALWESAPTYG